MTNTIGFSFPVYSVSEGMESIIELSVIRERNCFAMRNWNKSQLFFTMLSMDPQDAAFPVPVCWFH